MSIFSRNGAGSPSANDGANKGASKGLNGSAIEGTNDGANMGAIEGTNKVANDGANARKHTGDKMRPARFNGYLAPAATLLLASLACACASVALAPDFLREQASHILSNPLAFWLALLPIALLMAFAYFASGRVAVATGTVSLFIFLVCAVNRYKVFMRGDPLMPADFALGGEVFSISRASAFKIGAGVIALFVLIVAANAALVAFTRFSRRPRPAFRAIGAALCIALAAFAFKYVYTSDAVYGKIPIKGNQYNMVNEYNSKGVLLAFLYHTKDLYVAAPEGYSVRRAQEALAKHFDPPDGYGPQAGDGGQAGLSQQASDAGIAGENTGDSAGGLVRGSDGNSVDGLTDGSEGNSVGSLADGSEGNSVGSLADGSEGFRPDIIMVMSEAFWDITQVPSLVFSEDPIPVYHRLAEECPSGDLYTSVFGGGTDTTEFSVLTGHSVANYEQNIASAYKFLVRRDMGSIVRTLGHAGYSSLAMHPGYGWFYNRQNVYPWLGFDRFITMDAFDASDVSGNYISDDALADALISEYDALQPGQPWFCFAVSIQNHGPYDAGYMYGQDMKQNYALAEGAGPLSEKAHYAISNYVRGISDADRALGRLVDRLEDSARPAVLVFFGDHLPLLCNSFGAYRELGYPIGSESGLSGIANEYRTGYVVYANATARAQWPRYAEMAESPRRMSANYLGAYTVAKIGIPTTPYENLLCSLLEDIPVIEPLFHGDGAGGGASVGDAPLTLGPPDPTAPYYADLADYRMAQQYMLFDSDENSEPSRGE